MQPADNHTLDSLLSRAQTGDADSCTALYELVRVRLLGLVRFKVRGWSREDHEDLVQETMAVFSRDLQKIEHSPLVYAHAILQKRLWNELDKAHRSRQVSLEQLTDVDPEDDRPRSIDRSLLQDESTDIARETEGKDRLERVWRAIQSLHHEFCKPLLTAIMQGYEIGELWERFNALDPALNRNTFYKRVFDCRKRLWTTLRGEL